MLVAREHLLIMGIRNFPYQLLDQTLPDKSRVSCSALRRMTGNGMHSSAIGAVIFFALGSCEWA